MMENERANVTRGGSSIASSSLPTINVSPLSSRDSAPLEILDDGLAQLRDIVDTVQHMKDNNLILKMYDQGRGHTNSCPSIENDSDSDGGDSDIVTYYGSHLDVDCAVKDGKRRRSWTPLEEEVYLLAESKLRSMRSASLTSIEGGADTFTSSTANLLSSSECLCVRPAANITRRHTTASAHSLNEECETECIYENWKKLYMPSLEETDSPPLQKSTSTPSIAQIDNSTATGERKKSKNTLTENKLTQTVNSATQRPSGTESETEEETLNTLLLDQSSPTRNVTFFKHGCYDEDRSKRRKRSSLFFRKKDKSKKHAGNHDWQPASALVSLGGVCAGCSKSLDGKPALNCQNCFKTCHPNSCLELLSMAECTGYIHKDKSKNAGKMIFNSLQSGKSKNTGKRSATVNGITFNSPVIPDIELHHDGHSCSDETPLLCLEFSDETDHITDLETDSFLGLSDLDEPDTWTPTVSREILKTLKEKEIKRQEHIYEFILTEKHHCLILRAIQKIIVEGLEKHFSHNLGNNVGRMFPRLAELTDIHLEFLRKLRQRQRLAPVVERVGDLLLEMFSGNSSEKLKSVYGEFCSNHSDALDLYKRLYDNDKRFAAFAKYCQRNPLFKKRGIGECMLNVAQRLTKYPLLIEPLIKTSKEDQIELESLSSSLSYVKDVLVVVNAKIEEKVKEDQKLELYNSIDAKSYSLYRNAKFRKSDILCNNRLLRFLGKGTLLPGPDSVRGKTQPVNVVVLSDVIFFLVENNGKNSFYTPENKPGVIPLRKLLTRSVQSDPKNIYLIMDQAEPKMYLLRVENPKDKNVWINTFNDAIKNCPVSDEDAYCDIEKRRKRFEMKQSHIKQLVEIIRQKDVEHATILEDKIALSWKLLSTAYPDYQMDFDPPSFSHLASSQLDNDAVRKELTNTLLKVDQLTEKFYPTGDSGLGRSGSSVGEKYSNAYTLPLLPKRAETFGGFDNQNATKGRKVAQHLRDEDCPSPISSGSPVDSPQLNKIREASENDVSGALKNVLNINVSGVAGDCEMELKSTVSDMDQHYAALQLTSHIYAMATVITQQITTNDSLRAQLAICQEEMASYISESVTSKREKRPVFYHNQQLEELRNLQDKLTQEKQQWQREKDAELADIEEKRKELLKLQASIKAEQVDIANQREQLYRKLEGMNQATANSDGSHAPPAPPLAPINNASDGGMVGVSKQRRCESVRWSKSKPSPQIQPNSNTLPLNLISATNQKKVPSNVQVKQKLPLKLATKLGSGSSTPSSPESGHQATNPNSSSPKNTSPLQQQQMLPMKLREGFGATSTSSPSPPSHRASSEHQNLGGGEQMIPTRLSVEGGYSNVNHSRTESSPAIMRTSPDTNFSGERKKTVEEEQVIFF